MARKRASMREGPLAELFRATEAAQRQAEQAGSEGEEKPAATPEPEPFTPDPEPEVELPPAAVAPTTSPVTEAPSWRAEREAEPPQRRRRRRPSPRLTSRSPAGSSRCPSNPRASGPHRGPTRPRTSPSSASSGSAARG